jgi:hypothetical protein
MRMTAALLRSATRMSGGGAITVAPPATDDVSLCGPSLDTCESSARRRSAPRPCKHRNDVDGLGG